jgi:hypothetical protein
MGQLAKGYLVPVDIVAKSFRFLKMLGLTLMVSKNLNNSVTITTGTKLSEVTPQLIGLSTSLNILLILPILFLTLYPKHKKHQLKPQQH